MKELLSVAKEWISNKKPFAIATVIKTWGSSPRPVGSAMIVSNEMEMAGSVSGGCVEGAVVKSVIPLLENGNGQQLHFGVADEEAWEVGLSCGGKIQVYAERSIAFDTRPEEKEVWEQLIFCLENNKGCVLMTRLEDGETQHLLIKPNGDFFGKKINQNIVDKGLKAFSERKNQIIEEENTSWFAQVFPRKSQMIIIGAAHITVDLVQLANQFGFETIVIDPRGIFSAKTQFTTSPNQVFEKYPSEILNDYKLDAYTYAVVLSHDPKIDDDALHILLKSKVGYIGALGSRKTHAKRTARLEAAGFSEEDISKIHSPVGVDIKAKTPKEIALSIMGEVIKVKNEFL